jgi:F0F1-type ATP synthase assembly protein I
LKGLPPVIRLLGVGWYFAFCIVGGIVAGLLLDRWLNTTPVLTLIGLAAGLLLAFWGGYLLLTELLRAGQQQPTDRKGPNETE